MIYYKDLTIVEKARWMALLSAIDSIDDFCVAKNIVLDDMALKPVAIKHYINESYQLILNELKKEQELKSSVLNVCGVLDVKTSDVV